MSQREKDGEGVGWGGGQERDANILNRVTRRSKDDDQSAGEVGVEAYWTGNATNCRCNGLYECWLQV